MGACTATHQGPRTRRGTDLDVARITAAAPLGDQAVALAALHQRHRRLVAGLQAFGQLADRAPAAPVEAVQVQQQQIRSEEHTSELQSLMRISYAVFCLKKKTI